MKSAASSSVSNVNIREVRDIYYKYVSDIRFGLARQMIRVFPIILITSVLDVPMGLGSLCMQVPDGEISLQK